MNYILGGDSLTVFFQGKSYTINKQAHTYNLVLDAVKQKNEKKLEQALNIRQGIVATLQHKAGNKVSIQGNDIMYGDRKITGLISSRIFEMLRLGLDVNPMIKFLENLMQNPSKRAVDELFGFMEACSLPITEDGHFLAYKRIRGNYKDCHSGTMDNSVGKIVQMERNAVNDDKEVTCSYGLHACSYSYLKHFSGERVVVVKINPMDVVSVPVDYNNAKLRCCKYEVVEELELGDNLLPRKQLDDGATKRHGKVKVNSSAKLSEKDVLEIRDMKARGWSIAEICEAYSISRRQTKRIINRESWKTI